jgi:hypothetical protein
MRLTMALSFALVAAMAGSATTAAAFMFSDGTTGQCIARGEIVPEALAGPADTEMANRIGWAHRVGDKWQITWNAGRLNALPHELHDFLFFHECAHVRVPTEVEIEANCAGLIQMRAAGRAGPEYEQRLKSVVAIKQPYWRNTFACADDSAARAEAGAPPKPAN